MNSKSLIRTKFQRSTIGPDILPRPGLIERLENGRYRKLTLTLISAEAGCGNIIQQLISKCFPKGVIEVFTIVQQHRNEKKHLE